VISCTIQCPVDASLIAKLLISFLLANSLKEIRKQRKAVNWSICISLKVAYDDGEQEVLNLLKECWELTAERKGLKVSFETLGMFLATEFAIILKGFFCFIHCTFMLTQAFTDL
jgi:hypothetical protein